jgi:hypothetical protein
MAAVLRSPLTAVWALLSILTVVSCWLASQVIGGDGGAYRLMTLGVLALALVKVRLVIRHFMEVRSGPRWLRRACDAWLLCVFGMILAFYWLGL